MLKLLMATFAALSIASHQAMAQTPLQIFLNICADEAREPLDAAALFELHGWLAPQASEVELAIDYLATSELILKYFDQQNVDALGVDSGRGQDRIIRP